MAPQGELMCQHPLTRVTETRERASGIVARRKECLHCGERFTTMEVAETVIRAMGIKRFYERVADWRAGLVKRAATTNRRDRIEKRIKAGWKPAAIAHEQGVSEARVRQIRAELAQEASA
jgi:transcriptional regulator NrdR family protein